MKKEWELETQARFLTKERDWATKLEDKDVEYRQTKEMLEKLQRSNEEMK